MVIIPQAIKTADFSIVESSNLKMPNNIKITHVRLASIMNKLKMIPTVKALCSEQ